MLDTQEQAQEQRLRPIKTALQAFSHQTLPLAAVGLLGALGYSSDKTIDLGSEPTEFVAKLRQLSQTSSAFLISDEPQQAHVVSH